MTRRFTGRVSDSVSCCVATQCSGRVLRGARVGNVVCPDVHCLCGKFGCTLSPRLFGSGDLRLRRMSRCGIIFSRDSVAGCPVVVGRCSAYHFSKSGVL